MIFSIQHQLRQVPCKHAISCQYRACTGPMLAALDQYRPGTGTCRHVYRDTTLEVARKHGKEHVILAQLLKEHVPSETNTINRSDPVML